MNIEHPTSNFERPRLRESEEELADAMETTDPATPAGHEAQVCGPELEEAEEAQQDEYLRGYREAARIGIDHIQDVLRCVNSFKGNGHFAIRCVMAAHGMWSALSERDQVEMAEYFRVTRANVNKLVKLIQERLGLPPTLGQRSIEGCENMSERRKGQLKDS